MSIEENSQEVPAASQPVSEVLIKNLRNLTLNPSTKSPSLLPEYPPQQGGQRLGEGIPYRRRGVRTLLTAWEERIERMIQVIKYHCGNQFPLTQREPWQKEVET